MLMPHRSTIPSTHPALKTLSIISKIPLYQSKTGFITTSWSWILIIPPFPSISLVITSPLHQVPEIWVSFYDSVNFIPQINSIIKSCNYHMHEFKRIRKHQDQDTAISVANAIVGSRIDYCNSLLFVYLTTMSKSCRVYKILSHAT